MGGARSTDEGEGCECAGRDRGLRGRGRRAARRVEGLAYRILREPVFVALILFKRLATRRERP
ncbi:MAG: hypothetical protein QGH45_16000 [Myxococcota bacterium]|nr:hypothetical protein [Myxococcota bacterium]